MSGVTFFWHTCALVGEHAPTLMRTFIKILECFVRRSLPIEVENRFFRS